jgi:hypothetical protein
MHFEVCHANEIFIAVFLLTIIVSRWTFPIKVDKFKHDDMSNLLILYATSGGKIAELISYVTETQVVKNGNAFFYIISTDNFIFLVAILSVSWSHMLNNSLNPTGILTFFE